MAITSITLEAEVEALVVSIGAEDFDSCRKSVVKIRALLIALPDYGISGRSVKFGRDQIETMIKAIDDLESKTVSARKGRTTFSDFGVFGE